MGFTPVEDFWSDETHSEYCVGLSYTVDNDDLTALAERWVAEGKITLSHSVAQVSGSE